MYKGSNGIMYSSLVVSYCLWRKRTNNFADVQAATGHKLPSRDVIIREYFKSKSGSCPICRGNSEIYHPSKLKYYCLCYLGHKVQENNNFLKFWRTKANPATLQQLEIWGANKAERDSLTNAIEAAKAFIARPQKWLTYIGGYGCGKSHILKAIAQEFGLFAMYISAEEFEQNIFDAMEENYLSEMMHHISRAPILLFDDYGIEHDKDFVKAKFRAIVNFRYNFFPEYPLVLSTNMDRLDLSKYDGRVASRLGDIGKSSIYPILVDDYRRSNS